MNVSYGDFNILPTYKRKYLIDKTIEDNNTPTDTT